MSCALVCQTEKGDFATSISPPPSGVVATTSKVGSTIVSARDGGREDGENDAGRRNAPGDCIRHPSPSVSLGSPTEGVASQPPGRE